MLVHTDLSILIFPVSCTFSDVFQNLESLIIWLLSFEKVCKDVLGCHLVVSTGSVDSDCNLFSFLLEDLAWVVVFLENILTVFIIVILFLVVLQLLHPVARVAAV